MSTMRDTHFQHASRSSLSNLPHRAWRQRLVNGGNPDINDARVRVHGRGTLGHDPTEMKQLPATAKDFYEGM